MKYYETLMSSKREKVSITETQINTVTNALQVTMLPAKAYGVKDLAKDITAIKNINELPKNKKKEPLPYLGSFVLENTCFSLFVNEEKIIKDASNCALIIDNAVNQHLIKVENAKIYQQYSSLPIWEEVIHRFPNIHNLIVSLNPDHPWTLYRRAVDKFMIPKMNIFIGGYPQWRVNDIDFRKIKELSFIMEFQISENEISIYFFKNPVTQEIIFLKQKS